MARFVSLSFATAAAAVLSLGLALGSACGGGQTTDGAGGDSAAGPGGAGPTGNNCTPSEELCDGLDNDCNGQVDEGCACVEGDTQECYTGPPNLKGIGACTGGVQTCDNRGQWGDCLGEVLPADKEECNGEDDDCNGEVDEGFTTITCGLGVCKTTVEACVDGKPIPCIPGKGNAVEQCDGLDDNCDGKVDEGCSCINGQTQPCYTGSRGTKNVGACKEGTQTCVNGQWGACMGDVTPQSEKCDGIDNDCDGEIDEGNPQGGSSCSTGKLGVCAAGTEVCSGGKIVCQQLVQPSAEKCNGLDDNCDGKVDEGNPEGGGACSTGKLGVCAAGTEVCSGGKLVCNQNVQPSAEAPNQCQDGKDNDCNGVADGNDAACNCSHALCTEGAALWSGCLTGGQPNKCVTDICAIDPFCCTTSWDSLCVMEVRTICKSLTCDESKGSCPHILCSDGNVVNKPFPNKCDSSKANCVTQICAVDPYCCQTDWDSICVMEVASVCNLNCTYK